MDKLLKNKLFWLGGGLVVLGLGLAAIFAFGSNQTPDPEPTQTSATVDLADQTALPTGSRLVIQLREEGIDGPLVAEQTVDNPNPQDKSFEISYDPEVLESSKNYYLRVEVYDANDQLLFLGNSPYSPESPAKIKAVEQVVETPDQTPPESQPQTEEAQTPPVTTDPTPPITPPTPTVTPPTPQPQITTQNQTTARVRIHFDQDYNLPAGAELTVSLHNLGQLGESVNEIVASTSVTDPGSPPVAVELTYNPNQAPAANNYLIRASIDHPDGRRLMTNNVFGFEMKINQINNLNVHLVAIRSDSEKPPEDLDKAITGNITYQKNCQLSAGSRLVIKIQDVSLADAVSPIISEKEITDPGSSPVAFELRYDSSDIDNRNSYSLFGAIYGPNDQLLFINDTIYEVITRGQPTKLNLPLVKVKGC